MRQFWPKMSTLLGFFFIPITYWALNFRSYIQFRTKINFNYFTWMNLTDLNESNGWVMIGFWNIWEIVLILIQYKRSNLHREGKSTLSFQRCTVSFGNKLVHGLASLPDMPNEGDSVPNSKSNVSLFGNWFVFLSLLLRVCLFAWKYKKNSRSKITSFPLYIYLV